MGFCFALVFPFGLLECKSCRRLCVWIVFVVQFRICVIASPDRGLAGGAGVLTPESPVCVPKTRHTCFSWFHLSLRLGLPAQRSVREQWSSESYSVHTSYSTPRMSGKRSMSDRSPPSKKTAQEHHSEEEQVHDTQMPFALQSQRRPGPRPSHPGASVSRIRGGGRHAGQLSHHASAWLWCKV